MSGRVSELVSKLVSQLDDHSTQSHVFGRAWSVATVIRDLKIYNGDINENVSVLESEQVVNNGSARAHEV